MFFRCLGDVPVILVQKSVALKILPVDKKSICGTL
jgi:hypothetical protein